MAGSMARWRAGMRAPTASASHPGGPLPMVGAQRRHRVTADQARPDGAGRYGPGGPCAGRWPLDAAYSGQAGAEVPADLDTALAGAAQARAMFEILTS